MDTNPLLNPLAQAAINNERTNGEIRVQQERAEADRLRRELNASRQAAMHQGSGRSGSDRMAITELSHETGQLRAQLADAKASLLEWKHSQIALKRLTEEYAARLGITKDQRIADARRQAREVAEEDPQLANTSLARKSREA